MIKKIIIETSEGTEEVINEEKEITNKEIEETLVVWAGNANEILETVVAEEISKNIVRD